MDEIWMRDAGLRFISSLKACSTRWDLSSVLYLASHQSTVTTNFPTGLMSLSFFTMLVAFPDIRAAVSAITLEIDTVQPSLELTIQFSKHDFRFANLEKAARIGAVNGSHIEVNSYQMLRQFFSPGTVSAIYSNVKWIMATEVRRNVHVWTSHRSQRLAIECPQNLWEGQCCT